MLECVQEPTPGGLDVLAAGSVQFGLDLLDIGGETFITEYAPDPAGEVMGPGVESDDIGLAAVQLSVEVA